MSDTENVENLVENWIEPDEPTSADMDIDEETSESVEIAPEDVDPAEAERKSGIQKESFMEMFRIAPKIKDVLPDLKIFVNHPDVIEQDRKEVEMLVQIRIQEEKAKKKAEKASRREQEAAVEKPPMALADVIRSATGIDLAGILQKLPPQQPPIHGVLPGIAPRVMAPPPPIPVQTVFVTPSQPPTITLSTPTITSVGRGKAGFSTPHPNEIPPELRHAKPDLIAPIPDELRALTGPRIEREVPAIPNELLPPEQRVYADIPIVFVRPPLRKTLFLAGARAGKRSERIQAEEKKNGKKKRKRDESDEREPLRSDRSNRQPPDERKRRKNPLSGMNTLPQGLNKNSPLAVKRYHARQLAKDTGLSLEDAMNEIETQCAEFGGEDTPEAREHDAKAMQIIKKYGDERWNQKYNYTPADHSKGIPGVDRPPSGLPPRKDPIPDRLDRPDPIPGVDRPPMGRNPIPGVDGPPGGGFDRGFGADFGPDGRKRARSRGGVKERERKKKREEYSARRGGGGARGGGPPRGGGGGYDRWEDRGRDYGRGGYNEYERGRHQDDYDDYGAHRAPYSANASSYDNRGGYPERDNTRGYDDYYRRQEGYDQYQHHYAERGGAGYEPARDPNYDHYYQGGAEGQNSTYYQEDGGNNHYYSQYYGTEQSEGGGASEYHATFAAPPAKNPPPPPPPPTE